MEQFPDLLEYNNSLKGCSLIVGDFKFHYDVTTNTYTSRLIDLLESFNLCQSVTTPTHRSGHILDWVIHRKDDDTPVYHHQFSITNTLLSKSKTSSLPSSVPSALLPQRFCDFFVNKISTIRDSLSSQTMPLPPVTHSFG